MSLTQQIRNTVFRLMHFKAFRLLAKPWISLGNLLKKELIRYNQTTKEAIENKIFNTYLKKQLLVSHGLFKGLQYPSFKSYTSARIPKLTGTYESEIIPSLKHLLNQNQYDKIIDIGAAEGYYAVGIARRHPNTSVISYDANPAALDFCTEMKTLNQVDNLDIRTTFSVSEFASYANQRNLIICDVDGYELTLFSQPQVAQYLANSDLIIETHDYINATITQSLLDFFAKTHNCDLIPYRPNKVNELPSDLFKNASQQEKEAAVLERIVDNKWIVARAKNHTTLT